MLTDLQRIRINDIWLVSLINRALKERAPFENTGAEAGARSYF